MSSESLADERRSSVRQASSQQDPTKTAPAQGKKVVHHRKYGLHLLHPPTFVLSAPSECNESMEQQSVSKDSVESFLDDNFTFLEDYIQRKIHRSQLEKWLFRPMMKSTLEPGRRESYSSSMLVNHLKRQRSRSFTPLRKLSATTFEESGLSTPILGTDCDGQPTFLRKSKCSTSSLGSYSRSNSTTMRYHVAKSLDRHQSLLLLIEDILREIEIPVIAQKLMEGLKETIKCDHVTMLLNTRRNLFSGEYFTLSEAGVFNASVSTSNRLMTAVMTSKQTLNIDKPDVGLDNSSVNIGDVTGAVQAVLITPLIDLDSGRVFGALQVALTETSSEQFIKQSFSREEESLLKMVSRFATLALRKAMSTKEMELELTRSEVFLELAHTVFREQSRIEPTIRTILTNFLTMIECDRCQILLTDGTDSTSHWSLGATNGANLPSATMFQRVFDLQRSDLSDEALEDANDDPVPLKSFEGRFPINITITGEVAVTGEKVNIQNLSSDPRFAYLEESDDSCVDVKSLLCMPIRDSSDHGGVLGVICLLNKDGPDGTFTENDERFVEAFAVFCGMAIRNASDFERTTLSEAKLQVAFDTMNYQASSSEEEALSLAQDCIPSASKMGIQSLQFSYLGMSDRDTYKATIRMFTDLGLLSHFDVDFTTFCRWVLTVKKNYRNDTVPYHNWYHAFNVAQMMFAMLKTAEWDKRFSMIEIFGLMIACICHDLDHRGTTNSFQVKTKNPLATLYASSTLERHHLNQCLLLLNVPGNRILGNISEDSYTSILSVIERSILATDLALHFRLQKDIGELAERTQSSSVDIIREDESRHLLQNALITAADLGAVTKPWKTHMRVSQLVAEEFWAQGDLERAAFNETPPPMLDRQTSLAQTQIDFIENVCKELYSDMAKFHPGLSSMLEGALANKERWNTSEDRKPDEKAERARNL